MRQAQRPRGDHPDPVPDHRRDPIDLRILAKRLRRVRVQEQVRQAQHGQRQQPQRPITALPQGGAPGAISAMRHSRCVRLTQLPLARLPERLALLLAGAFAWLHTNGKYRPAQGTASLAAANV
jgi:hypothetical protein